MSPVSSQNLADTYYGDLICLGGGLYELEVILDTRNTTSIAGFFAAIEDVLVKAINPEISAIPEPMLISIFDLII